MSTSSSNLPGNSSGETPAVALTSISNATFIEKLFFGLPPGACIAACIKPGNPDGQTGWFAKPYPCATSSTTNNYVNVASFRPTLDGVKARKEDFAASHVIMLDDLGSKIPLAQLGTFTPSWLIETSPGNFQGGIILSAPITVGEEANQLLSALIDAGYCDPGAGGAMTRWMRLPVGVNGKPKYEVGEKPFQCRLAQWNPDLRYSPAEIAQKLGLDMKRTASKAVTTQPQAASASPARIFTNPVYDPRLEVNPIVRALKDKGLYKRLLKPGQHDVTCPWGNEHTDQLDSGAAYFEPSDVSPVGGFCCQHSHRDKYHIAELAEHLGLDMKAAKNRPIIRVVAGELGNIIDAADHVLSQGDDYFHAGGQIVGVTVSPFSGDPKMVPLNLSSLTVELDRRADWEKPGKSGFVSADPSERHVKMLFGKQDFRHLKPLIGLARQPYFRESDGHLVMAPGYDEQAMRYGVFSVGKYQFPEPTRQAAEEAVALLEGLLSGFRFASNEDRAVALGALLTAAVRTSLPTAPGFHVQAPTSGSGKSYLCELISLMAGPGGSMRMSYPVQNEEATKMMLAALQGAPAVIEFDDMTTDWFPHGAINRVFTAQEMSDRILGSSKTSTVSTRTLILGSGNNVGPLRDLRRRVATIHLDPKCEIPALIQYTGNPVAEIKAHREKYVVAALTIIWSWKKSGYPHASLPALASFGTWSSYCRQPLVWLGYSDPAYGLLEQLQADPDVSALEQLMIEWKAAYKYTAVTVRKVVNELGDHEGLSDALEDLPISDGKAINNRKLGKYLSKHRDRIVSGHKFVQVKDATRDGWRLVRVEDSTVELQQPASSVTPEKPGTSDF